MAVAAQNPALRLIRKMGLVRPVELESRGIPRAYTEDRLVEQPVIGLFAKLGWN